MKTLVTTLALIMSVAAQAETLKDCKEAHVGLTELMVPVTKYSRNFLNNKVQVYTIDQIEPACCSIGLAIVIPDETAELVGLAKCFTVTHLNGVDIQKARTETDSSGRLLLVVPTSVYDGTGHGKPGKPLKLRIDLKTATVNRE